MPSRASASRAAFASQAIFTASASSSQGESAAKCSACTARASPARQARPTVSSANSPSADFEIATATGAPRASFSQARNSLPLARIFAGAKLLQQAVEFHLLIDGLQQRRVGGLRLDRLRGKLHRHIGRNGRQALAHPDALDVILQALAVGLLLHFGRAL